MLRIRAKKSQYWTELEDGLAMLEETNVEYESQQLEIEHRYPWCSTFGLILNSEIYPLEHM